MSKKKQKHSNEGREAVANAVNSALEEHTSRSATVLMSREDYRRSCTCSR